jgi:hypothetical protein
MQGGNCIGEKIFMMILLEAWSKCTNKQEQELLICTVENLVNTGVFGTEESRSQWNLPVNEESELETVSFTTWRVRKLLVQLSYLAERIIHDNPERLAKWQHMLTKYLSAIKIAFQHEDLDDEELNCFRTI